MKCFFPDASLVQGIPSQTYQNPSYSEQTTTDETALDAHEVGPASGQSYSSWYLIADGTEDGQTWTFDLTGGSETAGWIMRRFSNWHGTTPPEESGTAATGTASSPNPASVSPSWGAETTTLYIAVAGCDETDPLTGPSGYDNFNVVDTSDLGASGPCIIGTAYKHSAASSDDPGAFGGTFDGWQATTVAIRPAAAPAAGGAIMTTNKGYW